MDFYSFIYPINYLIGSIWHPFTRIRGRENVPTEGNFMVCANHSSMMDPFWVARVLGGKRRSRFMAKKELMKTPLVGAFCRGLGGYGIDRGGADLNAIKDTLTYLKNGENVTIFPEGTRMKPGKTVEPKTGAVMLAMRAGVPILPVYIDQHKRPFRPIRVVVGKPYLPRSAGKRATSAELTQLTKELMDGIYAMGEQA